jgi:ABC-type lipoprotein export system ATPase subunit
MDLTGFSIAGLHDRFNVDAQIRGGCLILVGPNGTGKSTVINILYFALTRQWARLLEWRFERVVLKFGAQIITIERKKLAESNELSTSSSASLRRRYIAPLLEAGLLEKFLSEKRLTTGDQNTAIEILGMPREELHRFRTYLLRNIGELVPLEVEKLGSSIATAYPLRTIFLPTYRRIEKELKAVIPDFEERYRARVNQDRVPEKKSNHFVELVSFGMEDVSQIFDRVSRELRDYARAQINTLSVTYLRDIIRSAVEHFGRAELEEFTEKALDDAVSKVDDKSLTPDDKRMLRRRLYELRTKAGPLTESDEFLAHYAHKLVQAADDINKKENTLRQFVTMVGNYLENKTLSYDPIDFNLVIKDAESDQPVNIAELSSGEKQVVSLLSHVFLEQGDPFSLIIDEPELSLSVSWQTRFLPDILTSPRCKMLLAVTHSPFIFDNELQKYAMDVRKIVSRA